MAPTRIGFSGYNDFTLSVLQNIEDVGAAYVKRAAKAVGQLIIVTPRGARIGNRGRRRQLLIPAIELADRGFFDGYRLWQESQADITQFLDQFTIQASTATLIGPNRVLTAAHSTIPIDITSGNTFFIPNRTLKDPDNSRARARLTRVPKSKYRRVLRYANIAGQPCMRNNGPGDDWAILELEPADGHMPKPVLLPSENDEPQPEDPLFTLTHPLGLPLKYSDVTPTRDNGRPDYSRVYSDFGSGSSGAPLLQYASAHDEIVILGVITGNTKFTDRNIRRHPHFPNARPTIDPLAGDKQGTASVQQPVTLLSTIPLACLQP